MSHCSEQHVEAPSRAVVSASRVGPPTPPLETDLPGALEQSTARMGNVQQLMLALARAVTRRDVARAAVEQGARALGADASLLLVMDDSAQTLIMLEQVGIAPESVAAAPGPFPLDADFPACHVARTAQPLYLASFEDRLRWFPNTMMIHGTEGDGALATLPLLSNATVLGVLGFGWSAAREMGEDDVTFMEVIAQACALALERTATHERERQAREAAEQESSILRALLEHIPEGITIAYGPEMRIERLSRHAEKITGRSRTQLEGLQVGQHAEAWRLLCADGVTPAAAEALPLVRATRAGETTENEEWIIERADGEKVTVLCNAGPIHDAAGNLAGGIIAWRDITERKRLERELLEREESLRIALDAARMMTWEWHIPSGRVRRHSAASERHALPRYLSENTVDEFFALVHPDDRLRVRAAVDEAIRAGSEYRQTYRFKLPDGTVRWVEDRGRTITGDDGQPLCLTGVNQDITDRVAVEQEREEALALLDTLLAGVPVGFAFMDTDLRFRLVNDALAEINGVPKQDHIGRALREIVPDLAEQGEALARQVMETGAAAVNIPVSGETLRAPGVRRHWLESWYPVRNADGDYLGTGVVVVEVTEIRHAEQRIGVLNQRLHRAVYESSHRIKNHLQMLAATADMALMESGDGVVPADQVRRLSLQARMLAQIHDILTAETKDDAGAQAISLQAVLTRILSVMPRSAAAEEMALDVEDARVPVGAASALALAVNELVSNSLKHGSTTVSVAFRTAEGLGVLQVIDNGPGFPPNFNPARAANTGLDLIRSLVQFDLQGNVQFANAPQGGAHVTVTFPLRAAAGA